MEIGSWGCSKERGRKLECNKAEGKREREREKEREERANSMFYRVV